CFYMKILDKYLLREMTFPFIYGFLIILILVWGNIVYSYLNLIVSRINEWYLVLNFLVCKIPSCMLVSLAAGAIFGVSIGLNRITKDSEMVALRSGGISTSRIFISVMIFGLCITVLGYFFQEIVSVQAEKSSQKILNTLYSIPGDLPIEPDIFVKSDDYTVYVGSVERNDTDVIYHNVELYKISNVYPIIITADYASENNGSWLLHNGWVLKFNSDGSPKILTDFKLMKIKISENIYSEITNPLTEAKNLGTMELYREIQAKREVSLNTRDLELEFNFKLAFPLSTLVILFCLVPLCLMVPMKNGAVGMVLGIIIFFIYWNIMWFSRILGETGGLSPVLAGWSIVIIFTVAGLILSFILRNK
ncbi:MAG: LptF/LptG family permease, partial [Armatimonadetes bacterium]|nr:LptF/LptG family permease [Candidatus Hippobium faecium]